MSLETNNIFFSKRMHRNITRMASGFSCNNNGFRENFTGEKKGWGVKELCNAHRQPTPKGEGGRRGEEAYIGKRVMVDGWS